MLQEIKRDVWVTRDGRCPMPSEDDNCHLVTVTEEDIENCVRSIPRLDTLILVKAMGHRRRFGNPFRGSSSTASVRVRKAVSVRDSPPRSPSSNEPIDLLDAKLEAISFWSDGSGHSSSARR